MITLTVGGRSHSDFSYYEVDSDLLVPADAWRVDLGIPSSREMDLISIGSRVEIRVDAELVMSGRIDQIEEDVSKHERKLTISGRDDCAILVDCSSEIFTGQMLSLESVVAKVVRPLGITKIDFLGKRYKARNKVSTNVGERAWDVLVNACEVEGVWPWFEPDGTLVIGGPDYTSPEVAVLSLNVSGSNVISMRRTRNVASRFSKVTVLGQGPGTSIENGKHRLSATASDPEIGWNRPLVFAEYDCQNLNDCKNRARKKMNDGQLEGLTILAKVRGHHIPQRGESQRVLWKPGQRVRVVSDVLAVDAAMFLMARKFAGGRGEGATTMLVLKEDQKWMPEGRPQRRVHRQNKKRPLETLNLPARKSG